MSRKRGGAALAGMMTSLPGEMGTMPSLAGAMGAQQANANPAKGKTCAESEEELSAKIEEKNISTDTVTNIMKMMPAPWNYVVNPLMGVGVQSINNYRLLQQLFFSATLVKNKFQDQYTELMKQPNKEEIERDFKFACKLIRRFYYPDIGKQAELLRVSKEIHNACLEKKHLMTQLTLLGSVKEDKEHPHLKEDADFFNVFNEPGKFEELYNKLLKSPDGVTYLQDTAIHQSIEELFRYNGKNCSYIIPFMMFDIVYRIKRFNFLLIKNKDKPKDTKPDPKYGYIDEKLTEELCAIKHTYIEESCDMAYSLLDLFTAAGVTKLVENAAKIPTGQLEKIIHDMMEASKKAGISPANALKGLAGGSRRYKRSRRTVPKNRRPTRRRVKLIK